MTKDSVRFSDISNLAKTQHVSVTPIIIVSITSCVTEEARTV